MTARKSKNESEQDDVKTAGTAGDKDVQTTDEAVESQEQVPTSPEERGETDAEGAASGNVVGGVRDGDTGLSEVEEFDLEDEDFGWVGTVSERNIDGDEYDVPFVNLTSEHVARTSDSDDASKSWTAQHAGGEREDENGDARAVALVEVVGTPGQTFRERELPNRDVVEAAGINYEQWVATLPVRPDVPNEAPRRGIPA